MSPLFAAASENNATATTTLPLLHFNVTAVDAQNRSAPIVLVELVPIRVDRYPPQFSRPSYTFRVKMRGLTK
jgi:hypothetical protein